MTVSVLVLEVIYHNFDHVGNSVNVLSLGGKDFTWMKISALLASWSRENTSPNQIANLIKLETYVEVGESTGYFATVTRKSDHTSK